MWFASVSVKEYKNIRKNAREFVEKIDKETAIINANKLLINRDLGRRFGSAEIIGKTAMQCGINWKFF